MLDKCLHTDGVCLDATIPGTTGEENRTRSYTVYQDVLRSQLKRQRLGQADQCRFKGIVCGSSARLAAKNGGDSDNATAAKLVHDGNDQTGEVTQRYYIQRKRVLPILDI